MSATAVETSVKDSASSADVPVEGIKGGAGLSNPSGTSSIRQVVAVGDGNDASEQFAAVDADQNLHVINGRVATGTPSQVSASASAVSLLTSRAARVGVTIWNQGGSALYIGFANTVTAGPTGNAVWMIPPGQQWTMPVAYTGALYGIWDSTGGQANIADF